ncbi:MAG TPA: NAD(P)-binding oxidoreductase [Chitinophagaceae bacterium]|jgi:uncharacterized protein YbjT (DUF2867 family)|nr:NAD(P)-binding oxidoreductase [Chitinophagaceae bacterium]
MPRILFIGATGMLGKPVAKELIDAGFAVTLLARDPGKMQQLFPGSKIIKGDIFDRASLKKAFSGQDIVYMNLSVVQSSKNSHPQPEREGITNVIAIARETGIRRIAYLSSLVKNYQGMNGFNWWSFDIKQKAVEAIRSSGIAYSIFYPSTFMECLDQQMLRGKKLMLIKGSVAKMWFVAASDYGKQVAKAFQQAGNSPLAESRGQGAANNQEYTVQGETGYNFDEAARVFIDNYKPGAKTMSAPIGLLKFLGLFNQKMNYGARICEALNKYPEKFESQKTWKDLGKPSITLEEYVMGL